MSFPQRLPLVDGDDGQWGDIINQYLLKEHYDDGTDNAVNGGHKTVTIRAGTATGGTAPLKFTSGTLLSTPEAGAIEFNSNRLYFTQTTGPTRKVIAAFDDSGAAAGDVYYRDSSGNFVRLGIGTGTQVLSVDPNTGLPTWQIPRVTTVTKTSNYTPSASDAVILVDASSGNVTITLGNASVLPGWCYFVKRIDGSANTVSVIRSASDTIDGATTQNLGAQYTSMAFVSNGSNWYIV